MTFTYPRKHKPKRLEKDLVKACLDYLTLKGYYVWRNNSGVTISEYKGKKRMWRSGKVGSGDIIGIGPSGKFLSIECKLPGRDVTAEQWRFIDEVKSHGGFATVVYSLDDLMGYL